MQPFVSQSAAGDHSILAASSAASFFFFFRWHYRNRFASEEGGSHRTTWDWDRWIMGARKQCFGRCRNGLSASGQGVLRPFPYGSVVCVLHIITGLGLLSWTRTDFFLMMSTLMVASRHNSMNFLGFQILQCAKYAVITAPEGILNRISLTWLLRPMILFAIC